MGFAEYVLRLVSFGSDVAHDESVVELNGADGVCG